MSDTQLTDREIEVLKMVAKGVTNKNIAKVLKVDTRSMTVYVYKIRCKLGLPDRRAMMAMTSQEIEACRRPVKEVALTSRESEIAVLVTRGLSNEQIAKELRPKITLGSVEKHMQRIFEKLGLESRVQLAIYALKAGLVKLENIELP